MLNQSSPVISAFSPNFFTIRIMIVAKQVKENSTQRLHLKAGPVHVWIFDNVWMLMNVLTSYKLSIIYI